MNAHRPISKKQVLKKLRDRHYFNTNEQAKNVEADHLKFMDGVNRNFNTQAVDIKIQIEQAKHGRELTADEKNKIVEMQINRNNGTVIKNNPAAMQQRDQQAENALIA